MGVVKQKKNKSKTGGIIISIILGTIFLLIVVGLIGTVVNFEKEQEKRISELANIEEAILNTDTLIISKDLRNENNIKAYIQKEYPNHNMIEYKHIDSEYSAWDGTHNFYEFVLVKK